MIKSTSYSDWKNKLGFVLCMFVVILCLTSNVKCDEDSVLDKKTSLLVNKILRAYLLTQLDDLEKEEKMLKKEDDDESDRQFIERRQLKSQGIMSRLRNKMDHDLNKYGWD